MSPSPETLPAPLPPAALRPVPRRLWLAALTPALLACVCFALAAGVHKPITSDYLRLQDRWLLPLQLALAGLSLLPLAMPGWRRERSFGLSGRGVVMLAAAMVALTYAGHRWLLLGYDLSRDEQMAGFDSWIYGHGRLAWPLPAAWQGDAGALNLLFLLPVSRPVAWVSAYLPGNAALRALVGLLGDAALTGPLLTGLSVLLAWGCAQRLWPQNRPEDKEAGLVSVALLALSGQVVFAGMTAFAMPVHLAANLLWLWLFLGDTRRGDIAALGVGVFATGIHQPLFHPLFVAPWLGLLLWQRKWRRLALFAGAYGAIGLFWLAWPKLTLALVAGPHSGVAAMGADYLTRLLDILAQNDQQVPIMAANLLRALCWSPLALLALALIGAFCARRDARVAALLAGALLPLLVMGLILPYQGHGFGYRYIHGVLGNVALLGGYGWRRLGPWQARLRVPLLVGAGLSAVVALPCQALMTHRLYAPFARASAAISASGADYVMIGADDAPLALDLVRNQPDLANRPIRLSAIDIDDSDALARRICAHGAVMALPAESFYAGIDRAFGVAPGGVAGGRMAADASEYGDAGCKIRVLR